jgi:hypothetical protein
VPDLSVIGDPNTGFVEYFTGSSSGICHHSCSGGWDTIGGTSISSQLVGALLAVSAQSCGVSRLGFVNPALYAMASQGVGFTDVTTGNNDLFGENVYSAGPGYDMASGLGSPDASFISGICPSKIDVAKGSLVASSSSPTVGATPTTLTLTLDNANGSPLANTLVNVSATAASGTIVIDGDAASSVSSGSASYSVTTNAAGTAAITVATDVAGPLVVKITYQNQTIYSTTLNFGSGTSKSAATIPGAPSITKLTALVGGFTLVVRAPSSNGGKRHHRLPILDQQRRVVDLVLASDQDNVDDPAGQGSSLQRQRACAQRARRRSKISAFIGYDAHIKILKRRVVPRHPTLHRTPPLLDLTEVGVRIVVGLIPIEGRV